VTDQTLHMPNAAEIARLIDHTLLKPDATPDQIIVLCAEAKQYRFASVCVNPVHVKRCTEQLKDVDSVAVCTVIGFPLGTNLPEVKTFEAEKAMTHGATEVDIVQNIGALKASDGVRSYTDALNMVEAGATRIGASADERIGQEAQGQASNQPTGDLY
jgi:deoxyribose-phosphate aldolase